MGHEAAVRAALRAGDDIERLIARLGTADHPRGQVLVAYRNTSLALQSVLGKPNARWAAFEVMSGLRREMERVVDDALADATAAGTRLGQKQVKAQGFDVAQGAPLVDTRPMATAWMTLVDQQVATVNALAATGGDEREILGDEKRAGVLRPSVVIAEGARWIAGALAAGSLAYFEWVLRRNGQTTSEWYHQVVAGIDERTTDCCLRAHGQVQLLSKPFKLTGTPRYADELNHPPFHWYCRSSEAIVSRQQAGDAFTEEMVAAAQAELGARERTKARVEIHPADARSRR